MTTAMTVFEPQNLPQAMELASTLAKSALLPSALRGKPQDVLLILMAGRELSLSPLQALRGIHVIEGKPVLSADLMVAQCLRHSDVCRYFRLVASSDAVATYETQRAGSEAVRMSWTIEQAQRAKLTGKGNWSAHPAAMLRARCSSSLARAVYPDLVGGLYEESEGEEINAHVRPPPRPARVVDINPATPPANPAPSLAAEPEEFAGVVPPEDAEIVPEESPTAAMERRMREATTLEALAALVPEVKALPQADQAGLRAIYAECRQALTESGRAA